MKIEVKNLTPVGNFKAFLQRVANGNGTFYRKYGLNRGRTDLMLKWGKPFAPTEQRVVIELKVLRPKDGIETKKKQAIEQTLEYANDCDATAVYILIFDRGQNSRLGQQNIRRNRAGWQMHYKNLRPLDRFINNYLLSCNTKFSSFSKILTQRNNNEVALGICCAVACRLRASLRESAMLEIIVVFSTAFALRIAYLYRIWLCQIAYLYRIRFANCLLAYLYRIRFANCLPLSHSLCELLTSIAFALRIAYLYRIRFANCLPEYLELF